MGKYVRRGNTSRDIRCPWIVLFHESDIMEKEVQLRDRSSLLLLFDQISLPDRKHIPLVASLDTEKGAKVIKIKGKEIQNAKVVGGSAIVRALAGKTALGKEGTKKGLLIGAGAGAGAVLLSNMKEVKLPEGTELIIKLDQTLFIPTEQKEKSQGSDRGCTVLV
ncbi:MAG: hypothetical protein ABID54_06265 [Pseudomonadota bacterium]